MRDKMSTEDTAENTGEQEGSSLPERLQSLSDEQLARLAKECRAKRSQRPGDKQIREQYIEIQKELARRGASS